MGCIYCIIPFETGDIETIEWFGEQFKRNIEQTRLIPGKLPSFEQIVRLLDGIPGIACTYNISEELSTVDISDISADADESMWTQLVFNNIRKDFHFSKGNEKMIMQIMNNVSDQYGTFLLFSDGLDFGEIFPKY
jgi:hypothetical protein